MTDMQVDSSEIEVILERVKRDLTVLSAAVSSSKVADSSSESWDHIPRVSQHHQNEGRKCCKKSVPGKRLPNWLVSNVLLFSFLWQCINVILYRLAFNKSFSSSGIDFDVGVAVMLSFQLVQLLFIVIISVKLTKQMLHHTASNWFLVQCYLSTILLFAGTYTLIERASPLSFRGVFSQQDELAHELVYIRFLYFSTSVMTTCGFGDITSDTWYTDLFVTAQMLLSMLYTTVIFSKGLSFFSLQQPQPRKKKAPPPPPPGALLAN